MLTYFIGRWIRSSDNSYKGPEDEDDEHDVEEVASSTNSDEDDDAAEFLEFVEDPMDIESQISSPPSMTTHEFSCHAPLMARLEFTC